MSTYMRAGLSGSQRRVQISAFVILWPRPKQMNKQTNICCHFASKYGTAPGCRSNIALQVSSAVV